MKANTVRPHSVESGINISAINIPNCADEIVAPVVGETNLFIQICCMISPATLIPVPVQRIAKSLGSLDIKNIFIVSISSLNKALGLTSNTPINKDTIDRNIRINARIIVLL